ncbi:hypothetical protein Plhal304r1_c052g0135801 [Plasmopara halstedii]
MVGYPPAASLMKRGLTEMLKDMSWHIIKPSYAGGNNHRISRMVDSQGFPQLASSLYLSSSTPMAELPKVFFCFGS